MSYLVHKPSVIRVRGRVCRVAVGASVFIALGTMLLAPSASAGGRIPGSIFKALIRVEVGFQLGIEEAPAVLVEDLDSSNAACSKALEGEQSGASPQSSWTTLDQMIERGDSPVSREIIGALARSDTGLADLRTLISEHWRDKPAMVNELVFGVTKAQSGIGNLQVAVKSFGIAFERWEQHDCTGAQEAITTTNQRIPMAVEKINHGMERILAPAPLAPTGRSH